MEFDFEIFFQHKPEIISLRKSIKKRIEDLDQKFEGIEGCQVNFGFSNGECHTKNNYNFTIEISIPGDKVMVARHHPTTYNQIEVSLPILIYEAFEEIERRLNLHVRAKELLDSKAFAVSPGAVKRLYRKPRIAIPLEYRTRP